MDDKTQTSEDYEAPEVKDLATDEGPASIQAGAKQSQTIIP